MQRSTLFKRIEDLKIITSKKKDGYDVFRCIQIADSEINETEPCLFKPITEDDKAEYVRAEEYKCLENKLNNKIEHQNENIETLKDEFTNAMQYIKQVEEHITQMENNNIEKTPTKKKMTKKQTNEDEYVRVADGVYMNKKTNEIIDQECEIDDTEIFKK